MMDKLKWILAAVAAFVLTFLAFVYGKKTTSVLRAKARAHNAKGRVISGEIEVAEAKASREADDHLRARHMAKADLLRSNREKLETERLRLVGELPKVPDVELARRFNARAGR